MVDRGFDVSNCFIVLFPTSLSILLASPANLKQSRNIQYFDLFASSYLYLYGAATTMLVLVILLKFTNSDGFSMMIDLAIIVVPESVHVGVKQHHDEGVEQVEQQPGIHHLHVGGLGQAVTHIDKHRCQH